MLKDTLSIPLPHVILKTSIFNDFHHTAPFLKNKNSDYLNLTLFTFPFKEICKKGITSTKEWEFSGIKKLLGRDREHFLPSSLLI